MTTRTLGANGPAVGALGLGCNGMSPQRPRNDEESIATIQAALDAGITLLDTAGFYSSGHNETLIARAVKGRRDQAFQSVKCGALFGPAVPYEETIGAIADLIEEGKVRYLSVSEVGSDLLGRAHVSRTM